jgi:collagen type III alpha
MFRPDGDINFERDFGQWFNQDGGGPLDSMK